MAGLFRTLWGGFPTAGPRRSSAATRIRRFTHAFNGHRRWNLIAASLDNRKRIWIAGVAGVLASVALALLLLGRSDEVAAALGTVPVGLVLALAGLQAVIYLCRAASWNVALRCGDAGLCPHRVRGASGLAFTVNIVLPGYIGAAVRVAMLKRLGRAGEVGVGQLAMIDVLALAVEGVFLVALAIPLVAIFAPGYLWVPLGILAAIAAGVFVIGPARAKLGHLSWVRSLAVFGSARELARFAAPLAAVVVLSPLRFWLALGALGVNAGLGLAVVSFIVVSVVAVLPIGSSQAGVGGLGVLFASHGTEVVLATGVILAATAALGAVLYLIVISAIWLTDRVSEARLAPQATSA